MGMNSNLVTVRLAKELSVVRKKKVQQIKSKLSTGKYRVDNLELVKALFLSN
jgi:anti-sigma28 factor (negative regulator of flagellin synthesis)